MARSKLLANAEFEAIQGAFYGPEPGLNTPLGDALNWYSAMQDHNHARQYLHEYLDAMERHDDIRQLNNVPDGFIPLTAGWLSHLALIGYPLQDSNIEFLERKLKEALKHAEEPEPEPETPVFVPNVQQRVREKASELIGELEGMIDDGKIDLEWSLYDFLRSRLISAMIANRLREHFEPIAAEVSEALEGADSDLIEAYSGYSNDELANLVIIYQGLLADATKYASNVKKGRKPRAKKKPSVEKLLQHLQYQKADDSLKIVSIDPAKIIGAQELWTFSPKKKLLTVYRANDSDGLKIKRSSIVNINEQTSMAKKIGRHTEDRLRSVLNDGKVILRGLMDDISGQKKPAKRVTRDTILMRVL